MEVNRDIARQIRDALIAGESVHIPGVVRLEVKTLAAGMWSVIGGGMVEKPERKRVKATVMKSINEVVK